MSAAYLDPVISTPLWIMGGVAFWFIVALAASAGRHK